MKQTVQKLMDLGFDYGSAVALIGAGAMDKDSWLFAAGVVLLFVKFASDAWDKYLADNKPKA